MEVNGLTTNISKMRIGSNNLQPLNLVGVNFMRNKSLQERYKQFLTENDMTDSCHFLHESSDCILVATASEGKSDPVQTLRKLVQRNGFARCSGKMFTCSFVSTCKEQFYHDVNGHLSKGTKVRIHCHPNDFCKEVIHHFDPCQNLSNSNVILSPTNPDCLLVAVSLPDDRVCWGVYSVNEYREVIARPGDGDRDPVFQLNFNRAQLKIAEALQVLSPDERAFVFKGSELFCMDVGSAPGGWSAYLAGLQNEQHKVTVISVDPAELDPTVLAMPNIIHRQCRAEDLGPNPLYPSDKDTGASNWQDNFRLLTCDANMDVRDAVRDLILPLASNLASGGVVILTLKLGRRVGKEGVERKVDSARQLLDDGGFLTNTFRTYWLFSNSKNERTIVVRKR